MSKENPMATKPPPARARVTVQNILSPNHVTQVDAVKYNAMRNALLKVLPRKKPGIIYSEIRERVLPELPDDVFPAGATAGWWTKCVQLDLEAKGVIEREASAKPLRWHRCE
jgi:hypothetical protein